MDSVLLDKYLNLLSHLRTSHLSGYKAPHKAILMICVTELIRDNVIDLNFITINDTLVATFKKNWHKY